MPGKRAWMKENCVVRTAEEIRGCIDNRGVRDAGWWGWKTRKAGGYCGGKLGWRGCGTTGTASIKKREVRERSERVREEGV